MDISSGSNHAKFLRLRLHSYGQNCPGLVRVFSGVIGLLVADLCLIRICYLCETLSYEVAIQCNLILQEFLCDVLLSRSFVC